MITQEKTKEIIKKFGKNENDSGSVEVQVAILTERIKNLTGHFGDHKHDYHSKRGMMQLIGKRRRFLRYVQTENNEKYLNLIQELGLRK
jgi:small subunit ribosomal protein S15